jgi:hypothetical protein
LITYDSLTPEFAFQLSLPSVSLSPDFSLVSLLSAFICL